MAKGHRIGGVLALTLISVLVGLVLAVAYHFSAAGVQRFAVRSNGMAGPAVAIGGFLLRLLVIVAVFFIIGIWTPLNVLAVVLAFAVVFSILMIWSLYSLVSKQRSTPPGAGATGA